MRECAKTQWCGAGLVYTAQKERSEGVDIAAVDLRSQGEKLEHGAQPPKRAPECRRETTQVVSHPESVDILHHLEPGIA